MGGRNVESSFDLAGTEAEQHKKNRMGVAKSTDKGCLLQSRYPVL